MATREQRSLEERWRAFGQLDTMRNHWWLRPGWRLDRSFYTWHLTFEEASELHALVTHVQSEVSLPTLDLVPQEGLHLTMQGVGFADEVSEHDLRAIVEAASDHCRPLRPYDLALGPVDPDAEGVGLLVEPWAPVLQTREAIRTAIGSVWGAERVPEPATGFRPHVTVAYSAADADAGPLRDRLTALRGLPPASVRVRMAQLIRLYRADRSYEFDIVASPPFQG